MTRVGSPRPSLPTIGRALDSAPRTRLAGSGRDRSPSTSRRGRGLGSLDLAILRECSGEGPTGLGFDPRRSPEFIAKRLGVGPATVRRHMTEWRTRGFLLGYDVLPHPGLLGGRLAARLIDFPDPIAQERAIEPLSLIDGMIQIVPARTTLLAVYFVDSEPGAERRLRQLRMAGGSKVIGPEMSFEFPPCSRRMSRSDWRLVLALRRDPEVTMAELAAEVGRSARATSRRFDSLLDEGALMFDPIFEFSRFYETLAVLVATARPPETSERIARQIRELCPQAIPCWGPAPPDPKRETATLSLWVAAPTTAELDGLTAQVAHLPGVSQVLLWYGRSILPIRPWLNERIESVLRSSEPAGGPALVHCATMAKLPQG
jgi:DNA-binding Lrp family transcriptional regulator